MMENSQCNKYRQMLKYIVIILFCCHYGLAVNECHQFDDLTEQELWNTVRPSTFQTFFIITVGSLSILCLIITIATWKIYPSFSVPADIMFAICWAELIQNTSLVVSSAYFMIHRTQAFPPSFPTACTAISVVFTLGNTSSIIYNMVFCTVLSLSIRKPLKGTLFSQYRYHAIVLLTVISITTALSLSEFLGTGLNGLCGYKLQDRQSFARFAVELLIVGICIFSMYMFHAKVPNNTYFKRASVFGYYYYYMGLFSFIQALNTIAYLVGNVACRTGSPITAEIIQISITFGSCQSIALSFVLMVLRFSHPILRMKLKRIWNNKSKQIKNDEDSVQNEEIWLGSLVQSIKGSQIISFLSGVLISFAEHEFKIQKSQSISKFSFRKNYIFKLNEGVTDQYMLRRMSNGDNFIIKHKLGGLRSLQYEISAYAIQVFTEILSAIPDANIFKSFNINDNIHLVREKAYSDGGKSGQFFFGTFDNQFLIKTITSDEAQLYLEKIQQFYEYFKENPNSMIAKILGLYKFVRRDIAQEPTFLILMRNVSPYDRKFQERVYDIKGSEFNRSTIEDKKIQNPQKLRNHTLKDEDFKKLERRICILPEDSIVLKKQLKKDALFLGGMGVMDYSILIIKRKGPLRQRDEKKSYRFNQFPSYAALDQYYNLGIIDYLESWTLRRKAERAFKTMITNKKVTVTSPEEYSHRLSQFIDQII